MQYQYHELPDELKAQLSKRAVPDPRRDEGPDHAGSAG